MPDWMLGIYFLGLSALVAGWFFAYHAISRGLRDRHAARHAVLFGTPGRRKNGMDQFFSLLGFVLQDQSGVRDRQLFLYSIALKVLTVLFLATFIAMMFTPFFLHLDH